MSTKTPNKTATGPGAIATLTAKADVGKRLRRAREALAAGAGRLRKRAATFAADARRSAADEPAKARGALAAGGAVLASAVLSVIGWRRYRAARRNRSLRQRAVRRLRRR